MQRQLIWEALAEPGLEHFRLHENDLIGADGLIVGAVENQPVRLHYEVRCDPRYRFIMVRVSLYTPAYRSLLLYKLIKEAPLNFADGLGVFRALQSALMIVGIHHPDSFSANKYLSLVDKPDSFTGDALFAQYELSNAETKTIQQREKIIRAAFRSMGCFPLRRIQPGHGGSIHYAGSLPFNTNETPGSTHPSGRLHGTRRVFVADGSGFTYLPAKGITLTLMANAHRTAKEALDG